MVQALSPLFHNKVCFRLGGCILIWWLPFVKAEECIKHSELSCLGYRPIMENPQTMLSQPRGAHKGAVPVASIMRNLRQIPHEHNLQDPDFGEHACEHSQEHFRGFLHCASISERSPFDSGKCKLSIL